MKIVRLFLALVFVSLCSGAFAAVEPDEKVWTAPKSGFEMTITEDLQSAKGFLTFSDTGEGVDPGSGLVTARVTYVAMPGEEYRLLKEEERKAYNEGDMEKLGEVELKTSSVEWPFFEVYGINRGRGADELREILLDRNANPAYFSGDDALGTAAKSLVENMPVREIGEKDGLRYYLCWFNAEEYLSFTGQPQTGSDYRDEYLELMAGNETRTGHIRLTGGAALSDRAEAGSKLVFETTDLAGNPVSSAEIFAGHKVTMINMWATWCDPCKEELPALAKMAEEYKQKGGQFIGLCLDAEDAEMRTEAREILREAGVSYLNIVPFEGLEAQLPNKLYPTAVFVDENGILFDDVVSGAAVEPYPVTLDKLLNR